MGHWDSHAQNINKTNLKRELGQTIHDQIQTYSQLGFRPIQDLDQFQIGYQLVGIEQTDIQTNQPVEIQAAKYNN